MNAIACRTFAMNAHEKREELANLRFGPYLTPVIAEGVIVECEIRGLVTVVGVSESPIPWPLGERDGERHPIVFKALARAVRQESPQVVAAAWGVSISTAEAWRAACNKPRLRKKQTVSSPPIPWTREDDELVARLSLSEAARVTGFTLTAIRKRRRALGLPDGRTIIERAIRNEKKLEEDAAAACRVLRDLTMELRGSLAELKETFRQAAATRDYWRSMSQPAALLNHLAEVLATKFDRSP